MDRIAIIGAGISGLTCAGYLKDRYKPTIYEKEDIPGGLVRCARVDGNLFHMCGGHVFNSKRIDVLEWFWTHFDREKEFVLTDRNAAVYMPGGRMVPYPIENHVYMLDPDVQRSVISDMFGLKAEEGYDPGNFEDFLIHRFGRTLYESYFRPYNEKVWRRELKNVPLDWLEGKLPMPAVEEMIYNNFNHIEEKQLVHSTFWYEREGGSQFLADRLSEGLDIRYSTGISEIGFDSVGHPVVGGEEYDAVIFCGNVKQLPGMLSTGELSSFRTGIENLEYHGTTSVLCRIDRNPYSWIYQPDKSHLSHRIICTGNFSDANNAPSDFTATVEFTDFMKKEDILDNLKSIPFHPEYITHHYSEYTYPVQYRNTRELIWNLKESLRKKRIFLTGRFAEWEYYNMDAAMGAAMDLCSELIREGI